MDPRLAAELGVDRLHGQAVRLGPAVAAALTDPLVDEDPLRRLDGQPALALAPQLGRAFLVVDEDRDAVHAGQLFLGRGQPVPVTDLHARGQPHPPVPPGVLGRDHDLPDPLGQQRGRDVRHRHLPDRLLAAGHRHRAVVEQLERDPGAGGDRLPDGEAAGMVERPVANVLDQMRLGHERLHADPGRPFAAHVREADDLAEPLFGHEDGQRRAADPRADQRARRHLGRPVVRAPRAEVRGPGRDGQQFRPPRRVLLNGQPRLDGGLAEVGDEAAGELPRNEIGRQIGRGPEHGRAAGRPPAADQRRAGLPVQLILQGQLDEGALFLHDHDLIQAAGEVLDDAGLERGHHAELEDPHAGAGQLPGPDADHAQGLVDVEVRGAGGDDPDPGPGVTLDPVEVVGAGVTAGQFQPLAHQAGL